MERMSGSRQRVLLPHPSQPASMIAFVALPAFLILLTLVSAPLRVVPVVGPGHQEANSKRDLDAKVASQLPTEGPCAPRDRLVEVARQAVGPEYRNREAATMDAIGNVCQVVLWRLPKTPGGYRVVTIDARGKVLSVLPGR